MDVGCHRIEVLLNVFGKAKKVWGYPSNICFNRSVEDTACAHFEYETGSQALLTVTHCSNEFYDSIAIYGTEGSAHIEDLNVGTIIVKSRDTKRIENHPKHENAHLPLIEDFVHSILHNKDVKVDGQVGLEVNRILQQIYQPN